MISTRAAPESVPEQEAALANAASRALAWSFLNTVVAKFGTLAIGIALARLLGPEAFGTFAVATVALMAVLSFNELGVSLAIVRWKGDPAEIAPTVNTISAGFSLLLLAVLVGTAPTFAVAMGDPEATPVVRLMAVAVLINGVVASPAALLQREFRQKRRMAVDQVNTWLGAVLSLILVLLGLGAMSLAIGRIAGSVAAAVLLLRSSSLPYRLGFDRRLARSLLRFGLPLCGSSIIVFAVSYVDQLTAGTVLGATALGFYLLAFNLSSWPIVVLSQPLRAVAPAAFARLQDDVDRMNETFRSVAGLLAAVALPVCFLIAGAAEPLIRLIYGTAWAPAADVLRYLGLLAAMRISFELAYDYLVVRGRSRALLLVQAAWLAALVPAVVVGANVAGLAGLAAVQVVVGVVVVVPLYLLLLRRCSVEIIPLLGRMVVPLVGGAVVMAAALWVSSTVDSALWSCFAAGSVALLVMALLLLRDRRTIRQVRMLRRAGG